MTAAANDARFWDRIAPKYAKHKIADQGGYERTVARTAELLRPTDRVLEFGCGTGSTALRLAPHVASIVASDISGEMVAIARRKAAAATVGTVEFIRATLDEGPWAPESFDAVMGFNALHLVRDVPEALRHIRRVLKPGGLFISKTPCLGEMNPMIRLLVPAMQWIGKAPHVSILSAADLERTIAAGGFEILETANHATKGKRNIRPFIVARRV